MAGFMGLSTQLLAITIMILSYAIIFTEKINRAVVALFGGILMVLLGVITYDQAIHSIDFNTISLIMGMMIIMAITEKTGVFQFIAIWVTKKINANPRALLAAMAIITAFLSGYIGNVTAVLLITPVLLKITDVLKIKPFPYLMIVILSCNFGGAATLIGDPPNILVGSKVGLSFIDFLKNMTPLSYFLVLVLIIAFDFIWGRHLKASEKDRNEVLQMRPFSHLRDISLLRKSLAVIAFVIFSFLISHSLGVNSGMIAITGAVILLFLYTFGNHHLEAEERVQDVFARIDWITIFFFVGLFIIVGGLESTGILEAAGHKFMGLTHGDFGKTLHILVWASAGLSVIVDNIPFAATMIPVVATIEQDIGGSAQPLWWALLMGVCYGGNGMIISSSPNLIVAGIAAKNGHSIGFVRFMYWGIPTVIISTAIASLYIYLRFQL
jgi:Na+/H+ antiporter NhaD/arsenite permease-like protein